MIRAEQLTISNTLILRFIVMEQRALLRYFISFTE